MTSAVDYYYGNCYKYRRFGAVGSNEREHLADLIVNGNMMFSSPNSFNDPYDCRPVFIRGEDPKEDRRLIELAWEKSRVRHDHSKPSKKERSRHISNVMEKLNTPNGAAETFKPYLDEKTGVFCMLKDWSLITQWAHYADKGRGLCLEYQVHPGSEFDRVYEITYSNERPVVNITRTLGESEYRTEALFNSVIHKASAWEHEKEVRALEMGPGLYPHPAGLLTGIIVGQLASSEDVRWLLEILRANTMNELPVTRIILHEKTFSLQRTSV